MKSPYFYFKRFRVSHRRSAMKIGVDSVLLGGWVDLEGVGALLDIGAGCGILALMAAQRSAATRCVGIELEPEAAAEASENFRESPWSERLRMIQMDFCEFVVDPDNAASFDLLISNPPYFDSGVRRLDDPRMLARHQGSLSPFSILSRGRALLKAGGRVAMVVPAEFERTLIEEAYRIGYRLKRLSRVRGHEKAPVKRILIEFEQPDRRESPSVCESLTDSGCQDASALPSAPVEPEELVLEISPGVPTDAHRRLLKDFYLKY